MDNVSLRSLRTRQNVNYGDVSVLSDDMMGFNIATFDEEDAVNEQKSDQTTQPPRPPRVANRSRKPAGHQKEEPRDEFYTPVGVITSIITALEPILVRYTQGDNVFLFFFSNSYNFYFFLVGKTLPIHEPFCGQGHITRVLIAHGYKVIATDKYATEEENRVDFLQQPNCPECPIIITNSTYYNKADIFRLLFTMGKPFLALFPTSCIHTVKCAQLFDMYSVAVFAYRRCIKFIRPDGTITAFSGMGWFAGNFESKKDYIEMRYLDSAQSADEDDSFSIVGQEDENYSIVVRDVDEV